MKLSFAGVGVKIHRYDCGLPSGGWIHLCELPPVPNSWQKKACHKKWNMIQSLDVSNPEKVLSLLLQK